MEHTITVVMNVRESDVEKLREHDGWSICFKDKYNKIVGSPEDYIIGSLPDPSELSDDN